MSQGFRTFLTIVLFVGSIAIIGATLFLTVKEKKRARVIQDEIQMLEQKKRQYEHENVALQDRIAYLQSEHSYEKEAKKLNYKKPGEHVVIVRRSKEEGELQERGEEKFDVGEKKEHYQIWLEYFF
ncbi:MAG: hypothetical protein CR972_01915 [Candidatus Moraniibacteriota bacterium]|nr:MAG: hypothetical protein CR972_01915 [Candidatus Moranbacteria bacterium]